MSGHTIGGNGYSYGGGGVSADSTGHILYDFEEIASTAGAIGTYVGTMEGALSDLYRDFMSLFGNWDGEAKTACHEAKEQWDKGAEEIKQALFNVGRATGVAGEDMQAMDKQIAARMRA